MVMHKMFNKTYNRMGYFYDRKAKNGSKTYATFSKGTPTDSLLKNFEGYKKNPMSQRGFGIGLITDNGLFSTICVDIDNHDGLTNAAEKVSKLSDYLKLRNVTFGVERNESSKGYHVWILGEECEIKSAVGLLTTANKYGTEVFPMVGEDGSASRFIRLPGLYKDGVGRSYVENGEDIKYLTTIDEVSNFFQSCENGTKSLVQILQVIIDFFSVETPMQNSDKTKIKRVKRVATTDSNVKYVPVTTDELNRIEDFLSQNDDVFTSSKTDRFNFNSNDCEALLQLTETKTLLMFGKDCTLADDILVGIDRVDKSNNQANSFAIIDRYSRCGLIEKISFLRNRDNGGVVLFDSSRKWTVDDLVKRAPDLPELEYIYSKVKLEKVFTPISSTPFVYNYRVEYDFLNNKDLETPQIYTQENKARLGAYLGVYIERVMGARFTKKLPIRENECVEFLNSLYALKCSFYCGGIVKEFSRVAKAVYTQEQVEKAYETILDIVNLDTDKTSKEVFKTFLEVLFKKASMRLYNCLPDATDDVVKGIDDDVIKTAITNRINVPLTNALVVMGESGSGKTTLLRLLCEGISSVIKFGGDNKIHPTRSVNANMISNSSLDSRMDVSASLFANPCSYFTEYNPKPAELEVSQAFLVGFLSKLTNTERYAHEKHIISSNNLCCFLGFDTDCSSIFSFKAGNKRRFLPIWLKKRANQNSKILYKVSEAAKLIVEYYLTNLLKTNSPYFTDDFVFSDEISNYISQSVSGITKVKSDLADTLKEYVATTEMYKDEKYQLRKQNVFGNEHGIKGISQYSNCDYVYIYGKTVSSVLNQFYGWKENKLGCFKEDSQEVALLTGILKENGIDKGVYKLNGKNVRTYKILFVIPQYQEEETKNTNKKEMEDIDVEA